MEDLFFPAVVALVVLGLGWGRWYGAILMAPSLASPRGLRRALALIPLACLGFLVLVLLSLSSSDVRPDVFSTFAYFCIGAGWLGGASILFPFLGVSPRDDVLERGNWAALWPVGGALVGVTLCFAGANIGNGPGPEVVFFCSVLSTGTFFLLWLALELIASPSEAITVERDEAAGVRVAGFLVAIGILLGRAVAGDWQSIPDTLLDFCRCGWPALFLLGSAATLETIYGRKNEAVNHRDWASFAVGPLYILASVTYIAVRGRL